MAHNLIDTISGFFPTATISHSEGQIIATYRAEMNQNIEEELPVELSEVIDEAENVRFQCNVKDGIGFLKITFTMQEADGQGITIVERSSGIKSYREYRERVDREQAEALEFRHEQDPSKMYHPSEDFDPDDEASMRKEALRLFEWMEATAGKLKNVDFTKLQQHRELKKLVNETNFGVFTSVRVSDPEPNEDASGSVASFECEFQETGFFDLSLSGKKKDAFSRMIKLSNGVFLTVGFYDGEETVYSIEFLFGVSDVYI